MTASGGQPVPRPTLGATTVNTWDFWRPNIAGDVLFHVVMQRTTDAQPPSQEIWARLAPVASRRIVIAAFAERWLHPLEIEGGAPAIPYDAVRPSIGRMLDFEAGWSGAGALIDDAALLAVPQVRLLALTQNQPVP